MENERLNTIEDFAAYIKEHIVDKVAYFEVKAEGGQGTLKYQWYYSSDAGKTWTKATWGGNNTNRVGATAFASREGWLVRSVITDEAGNSVTSGSAKLHVNIPITITKQPSDQTQDKDKVAYFEVKAEGGQGTLKYQWYYSSDAGKTWTKATWGGNNTNRVGATAFASREGWLVRSVITDGSGTSVTSVSAKLHRRAGCSVYAPHGAQREIYCILQQKKADRQH